MTAQRSSEDLLTANVRFSAAALFALLACEATPPTAQSVSAAPSSTALPPPSPERAPAAVASIAPALEEAAASGRLVLVVVHAAWCAPCAALERFVLTPEVRASLAGDVVLVELDLDRLETAPFSERYGVYALPNLVLIDPASGERLAQRSGELDREELRALVASARAARAAPRRSRVYEALEARERGEISHAAALLAEESSDASSAARDWAGLLALDLFQEARDGVRCVELADRLPPASSEGAHALARCSTLLEGDARRGARDRARARLLGLPDRGPAAQADALATLAWLATERGDERDADGRQRERLAILEEVTRNAAAPDAVVFDAGRAEALVALRRTDEALSLLARRTTELPERYEVWGRYGSALLTAGRSREAIAPLRRARDLAYGAPRCIYDGRLAEALEGSHARDDALRAWDAALAGWASLPPSQRDPARERAARGRRDALAAAR
jgi:thioredoxin-like negative regulator of GroEL